MAHDELILIAPDPKKHRDEMYDLIAKVFSHQGYFEFRDYCRDTYIGHSHYDWAASRIGMLDGKIVAHYGVWDYQMRIGQAQVRVGGIGAVATHGDYRGRGLITKTAIASIDAMAAQGYDMTALFGIDNFYDRFGYVRAWSDRAQVLAMADLPEAKAPKLKAFNRWDDPSMIDLGNRAFDGLTASAVRPTYELMARYNKFEGYRWNDGRGRPVGYVVTARDRACSTRLLIVDAVGEVEQVLAVAAALARRKKMTEVKFSNLHPAGPLSKALVQMTSREETSHRRCGGPMIRTLSLRSCLTKMQAELSARLGRSSLARWTGRLLVADCREKMELDIRGGQARVAGAGAAGKTQSSIRGGEEIAQLLIGTNEPMETVAAGGIKLAGNAPLLLPVLFPAQHPMLAGVDRY